MDELIDFGFDDHSDLLGCGVYALLRDEEVIYIGQTTNAFLRIADHRRVMQFDRVFFMRCRRADLNVLEWKMIRFFEPRFNTDMRTIFLNNKNLKTPKNSFGIRYEGKLVATMIRNGGGTIIPRQPLEEVRRA